MRNNAIWVWMGDPECADDAYLPQSGFPVANDYASEFIYLKVGANYQIVIDNLLDLTHAPFLHAATLAPAGDGPPMLPQHEYSLDGEVIHSNYIIDRAPTAPSMQPLFADAIGLLQANMTWRAPANLELDVWMRPLPGSCSETVHSPSLHYLTPESEYSTHYFAAVGRNVKLDDRETGRK